MRHAFAFTFLLLTPLAAKELQPSVAARAFEKLPLQFEPNEGQAPGGVRYLARGSGYAIFLTARGATLSSPSGEVTIRFENGHPASIEGDGALAGRSNYFIGSDPGRWRTGIPQYQGIRYRGVYPGIDVVFYGNQRQLEYDFVVAPGADPRSIRLAVEGAGTLRLARGGELVIPSAAGEFRQHKPVIYQEHEGRRIPVKGSYRIAGRNRARVTVGDYDRARPLIIDPVLTYSTYLGGGGDEAARGIAVDATGSAYIVGRTTSTDFRTVSAVSGTYRGNVDIFVAKLNPAGNALVYSTYIGGANMDTPYGIALDAAGSAYVTGETASTDLPMVRPFQSSLKARDVFVLKLNAAGNALSYSTYLGGNGNDRGAAIAVDGGGNAYVAGVTQSADYPVKTPISSTLGGGQDAFVTKLSSDGSSLVWSTLLGGAGGELAYGVAVDSAGSAYVTGTTGSNAFQTANPLQRVRGGAMDAFVSKLAPSGSTLVYSTYIGGAGDEEGDGIAIDQAGNAYIAGFTNSANFPLANPAQRAKSGAANSPDAFALKLNAAGSALVWSTYLGGTGEDAARGIALDVAGNAYVAGMTASDDFPSTGALQARRGVDAFLTQYSPAGELLFSTWFGGSGQEGALAVATDAQGSAYITGASESADLPVLGALQSTYAGSQTPDYGDAFIAKFDMGGTPAAALTLLSAASFAGGALCPDSIVSLFGQGLADALVIAPPGGFPDSLGGVSVKITDSAGAESAAQLYFVSPGQINFVMPAGVALGAAQISVLRDGRTAATGTIRVDSVAPGLFTANSNGKGPAAARWARYSASGDQSSGIIFQCPSAGNCANLTIDLGGDGDQTFLMLFGTGLRGGKAVTATIGGAAAEVLGPVPQGEYPGFDQVNLRIPRSLVGRGEVDVALTVDGKAANVVTARIGGAAPVPVPRITSLTPTNAAAGQTIFSGLTITGQDLAGVTSVEFSPAAGITVFDIRSTATSVTAEVTIDAGAAPGMRTVTVASPGGRSNSLQFEVRAAPPPPPTNQYMPVKTGLTWDYRVTFPETVRLPYRPTIEQPAGMLCASVFCGTKEWAAGQINFRVTVNESLGESFRVAITDPGRDFYFAHKEPVEMRVRTVQGSPQLELVSTPAGFRLVRPLARPTEAELAQKETLTVAAGTYSDVVKTTLTLNGDGIYVAGTYTTDVYLAPGVGLIKAVMKNSAGKILFMQELTGPAPPATGFVISNLRAGPSSNGSTGANLPITVDFEDPSGTAIGSSGDIRVHFDIGNGNSYGFTAVKVEGATPGQKSGTMRLNLFFSRASFRLGETVSIKIALQNALGNGPKSNELTGTFQTQ